MNNRIYEEALASALKRIEALEEFNKKYYSNQKPPKQFQQNPNRATSGQIWKIKNEGGKPWEGMTKSEATKEIDRLLKLNAEEKTPEDSREPVEIPEVKEPEEVDTDDAGLEGDLI